MKGKALNVLGDTVIVVVPATESDGATTMIEVLCQPGGGPPLHTHREAELFYVLEGELELELAGAVHRLGAGEAIGVPPGAVHTFRNVSGEPARFLVAITPGGLERFFVELAEATADGPPDMAVVVEISARHGIEFVGAPAPA